MSTPRVVFLALNFLVFTSVQSAENTPFDTVRNLFAAMSAFDYTRMESAVTNDFQLLEDGEVWDINTLISAIRPGEDPYVRRNFFSLIKTESKNEIAWVSYWNRATFTASGSVSEWIWLESALLIKGEEGWQVQLMHSTPVSPGDMPTNVEFEEHTE